MISGEMLIELETSWFSIETYLSRIK